MYINYLPYWSDMALRSVAVLAPGARGAVRVRRAARGVRHRPHRRRRAGLRLPGLRRDARAARRAQRHHRHRRRTASRPPPTPTSSPCPPRSAARTPSPAVVQVLRDAVDRGAWVHVGLLGRLHPRRGRPPRRARAAPPTGGTPPSWPQPPRSPGSTPTCSTCEDGTVITSAGTAAGIDAALHLVRTELGSAVATAIARRMVVPPHRDGGQRQFVDRPVPTTDRREPRAGARLDARAPRRRPSPSTTSPGGRRCRRAPSPAASCAETGTTPHQWVTDQRVLRARHCSRTPTCRSRPSPATRASGRRPCCATTSPGAPASRPRRSAPSGACPPDLPHLHTISTRRPHGPHRAAPTLAA